jgi:uncharacterized protein with HEPN domain
MSKRTDQQYLGDMLDYGRRATALVAKTTREEYERDDTLQAALSYMMMVVGEAAYRLSDAARARHSALPWPQIMATRHRLVHDYGNIDPAIVWEIAVDKLPALIAALEKITPPEPPSA